MSERLQLEHSGGTRAELPVEGTLVLGRDRERAGLVVEGEGVADLHCAIARARGGGWAVKDLGSLAGTVVNGQRVAAARLNAGDELVLGAAKLRVVDAQPGRAEQSSGRAEQNATLPVIPGYRCEKRLGRGGMGEVFLAVQERLARQVALKILAPRLAGDATFVRRFEAEARAAAALNHPNVVTVYDVGEHGGVHYLSMEYMDRGTLEERLQEKGRYDVPEVLAILDDAARGLQYAESRGIVHRDLKPANLMQNHAGQTKIADLGLATHVEAEEIDAGSGKVFGTPHFLSPEQARGERADARSDLYSLGATAYRLLTGRTPHAGDDPREIVRALLRDEPRPLVELAPEVPSPVAELVARLMKKDPAQRTKSATELLAELERLRASKSAPSPSRGSPVLVPILLLALAAGIAWWWVDSRGGIGPAPAKPDDGARAVANAEPAVPPAASTEDPPEPAEPPVATAAKDDRELQLFEANAKVQLFELLARELPPAAKRDELRLLAGRFQGTSAATDALAKADMISAELDSAAEIDALRRARVNEVLANLRTAGRLDEPEIEPGRSLLAMRAVPGQQELLQDPDFVRGRADIESTLLARAVHRAKEGLGEAARQIDAGKFEEGQRTLAALMPLFELPDFPLGGAPAGASELFEVGRSARERLRTLEQMASTFERKRAREEQLAIAGALGGPSGLERELGALDFGAALARVQRLDGTLRDAAEQAWVTELAGECAAAREALLVLVREFPQWRRRSVDDPREKKSGTRTAIGADAEGLLIEGAESAERIPWSAYGGKTRELGRLFVERLQRDWTPTELAGIAALVRTNAVLEAARSASKMFDSARKANFTEANAREMKQVFEEADPWAKLAGPESVARLERERAAAELLCEALRAATEGRWPIAATSVEMLLRDHGAALLVRLYSDGRPPDEVAGG